MKNLMLILIMILYYTVANADIIYVTDIKAEADLVVYVTESEVYADMIIKITDRLMANEYSNCWYFTTIKAEADKIVFYSEHEYGATKIFYTESTIKATSEEYMQ